MRAPAHRRVALPTALVLATALVLTSCSDDESAGIEVAEATRGTVAEVVEAPATVTARASATVTSAAGGTIEVLRVREGELVRRGQVLLRVESPQTRRNLRQALRADRRAAAAGARGGSGVPSFAASDRADRDARAAFRQAARTARRIPDRAARRQALAALRATKSQYAAARADARRAAAALASGLGSLSAAVGALSAAQRVQTRAAVSAARSTLAALTVRAPIAGTVSFPSGESTGGGTGPDDLLSQLPEELRSQAGQALGGGGAATVSATVAEGAPVSSGQRLVTVTDTSRLTLTAQVDETDVLLVRDGIAAAAELDAVPDATYPATVTTVDPAPTTSTRGGVSYLVRLALGRGTSADGGPAPVPRAGMSAVVDLRVRTSRDVVAVPAAAVFRSGRRDAVYVVKNDVPRLRVVRLGAQGASRVEVVEGLEEGERLVVRGVDRVRAGQPLP